MAMKLLIHQIMLLLSLALSSVSAVGQCSQDDIESGKVLAGLSKIAYDNATSRVENGGSSTYNKENVQVYKKWRNILGDERIEYTKAAQCSMDMPGIMSIWEGSKTAFGDFTILHILLVQYVHVS
ncbi:hypothetical protein AB5N19_10583 [Seiridium cardinale]|uniref:Uncharacterized protein n=1 Tax=Seiridium cardinale TaxID=138064 RepID=A0ABR2XH40_9PEZI